MVILIAGLMLGGLALAVLPGVGLESSTASGGSSALATAGPAAPAVPPAVSFSHGPAPVGAAAVSVHPLSGPSCTTTVSGENGADNALQTAIDAAASGNTICIGAGTYPEQLTITTPGLTLYGAGNASTIIAPTSVALSTVDWDSANGNSSSVPCGSDLCVPTAAIILVANTTGGPTTGVTIENLEVNGAPASSSVTCGDDYVGVDFQDSSGTLTAASVMNVASPLSSFGCQEVTGAVYAYNGYFYTKAVPSPAIQVAVTNSTVTGYQKNGITCDDLGESCTLSDNTVTGIGATTLTAQNGIQVGFGANATVTGNRVFGDHYTGGVADNANYFTPVYTASGILVDDAGNLVQVTSNVVGGDDLGIAVFGTASANVSMNDILQAFSYGITFDLNASSSYLGMPVYSTDSTWTSTAFDNTIQNVNVGMLVYDDNLSISDGSANSVNVSVESMTDHAGSVYSVGIDQFQARANVSGALLGDLSSFQATTGFYPKPLGVYSLVDDNITSAGLAPPAGSQWGVKIDGASAQVLDSYVGGFVTDIFLNPTIASGTVGYSRLVSVAALGEPGMGIWAGNQAPDPTNDTTATITILNNSVVGPGGTTDSPLAGGAGILAGGASVTISGNSVFDFSAVMGSSPTTPTGPGSGYDWWQGTQSVGIMVGCAPTSTAAQCLVEHNWLYDNAIGVAVILTNSTFGGTWQTGPITISYNSILDSGGYGIYTSMGGRDAGPAQTSVVTANTINNTLTGAPALYLAGQAYDITDNVLVGTSANGTQGPVQGEGGPSIATASVEATDYWDYSWAWTTVTLNDNVFLDTSLYWSTSWAPGSQSNLSGGELATFSETGLPVGTLWSVTLPGPTVGSVPAPNTIVADVPNGSTAFEVAPPVPGYVASPSSGTLNVSDAPVSEVIAFVLEESSVTFTESGLPHGTTWWLNVTNGPQLSSASATVSVEMSNGNYAYVVGVSYAHPRDYSAPSGTFAVNGHAVSVSVGFVPVRPIKVTEWGLPSGTEWWVYLKILRTSFASGTSFHTTGSTITMYLGSGMYTFSFTAGNGDYSAPSHTFTVTPIATNAPRLFNAVFHLVVFPVRITETGLPHGAGWCLVITGGRSYCTHGASVRFTESNGSYNYTLTTTARGYVGAGGTFTVSGAPLSKTVTFTA